MGSATSRVSYSVDANGAMTSDGLRTFEYDESRRRSKVKNLKDGEAAAVDYLHNALGQVFHKLRRPCDTLQILPRSESAIRVIVEGNVQGTVVCDYDNQVCLSGYEKWLESRPMADGNVLSGGIMIQTHELGFVYYSNEDVDIRKDT